MVPCGIGKILTLPIRDQPIIYNNFFNREEMETKLKSSVENIHNIVRNFTNNITELVTVSRFRDNQMKELRSIVQASQSLNEISDSEIRVG